MLISSAKREDFTPMVLKYSNSRHVSTEISKLYEKKVQKDIAK